MNREFAGVDPSRRLDIQVHTVLFGGTVYEIADGDTTHYLLDRDGTELPSFSSDWRGIQLVVEAMTARGWAVMIESNASGFLVPWTCLFASRIGRKSAIGMSAPEAVARAALAALGVPLPQETTP